MEITESHVEISRLFFKNKKTRIYVAKFQDEIVALKTNCYKHEIDILLELKSLPFIQNIIAFFPQSNEKFSIIYKWYPRVLIDLNYQEINFLKLARDITMAVYQLHNLEITHLDIKPDNILINDNETCLADFGLSRKNIEKYKFSKLIGTLEYMSPEIYGNCFNISKKTDIFSLGVTFYIMLSGREPFNSSNRKKIKYKILNGKYQKLENIEPKISTLIYNMMSINPDDRPNALEILEILK